MGAVDTAAAQHAHDCLSGLGLQVDWSNAAPGHLGKWLLPRIDSTDYIKLAPTPAAASRLRLEAAAYASARPAAEYVLAGFSLLADRDDWAVAVLTGLAHRPCRRRAALSRRCGPFEHLINTGGTVAQVVAEMALDKRFQPWAERLIRQAGDVAAERAPAHGDFVYWNLGIMADRRLALFDLEYYQPLRYRHFDRLYWSLLPVCRQAVRRPWLAALLVTLAPMLAAWLLPRQQPLWPGHGMALMLLDHGNEMAAEHADPVTAALFAPETLVLRKRLLQLYERLLARLLR
jgi:hypothetical protein